jgi:hypothetical protein
MKLDPGFEQYFHMAMPFQNISTEATDVASSRIAWYRRAGSKTCGSTVFGRTVILDPSDRCHACCEKPERH